MSSTNQHETPLSGSRQHLLRVGLFVGFFFVYAICGYQLSQSTAFEYVNVFFQADVHRVVGDLTIADFDHYRTKIHPLFVLFFNPLGTALSSLIGSDVAAAVILNAAAGATAIPLFHLLLARSGVADPTATCWALLLGFSSSHMLFGACPESFIFTGASLIIFCVVLTSASPRRLSLIGAGLLAFAVTTTNLAITAIVYLFFVSPENGVRALARPPYAPILTRMGRIFMPILGIAFVLSIVQKVIYPSAQFFFTPWSISYERHYLYGLHDLLTLDARALERILDTLQGFLLYNLVAPKPSLLVKDFVKNPEESLFQMFFQPSNIADYPAFGYFVVFAWITLLAATLWIGKHHLRSIPRPAKTLLAGLTAAFAFQFLLHLFYGDHAFLYSPHWTFMLLAAMAIVLNNLRSQKALRMLLAFLIFGFAINNALFLEGMNIVLHCSLLGNCPAAGG